MDELLEAWGTDHAALHDRLRRFYFDGVTDHSLRNATLDALKTQASGDPDDVLLFLGDLLVDRLSARLTAQDLWMALQERGTGLKLCRRGAPAQAVEPATDQQV
jgi:hypothetical protein